MQNYDNDRDKENIFEMDVSYPKHLQKMNSHLQFLSEKIDKCQKLICNMLDKKKCIEPIEKL